MTRYIRVLMPVAAVLMLVPGCKKFVSDALPEDQVVTVTAFADEETATSAINGLYSQMTASNLVFANGAYSVLGGLAADELYRTSSNTDQDAFASNTLSGSNLTCGNLWNRGYAFIYHTNAISEAVAQSAALTAGFKKQLTAEARFCRAFCYLYLVNSYGDVPLITGTDYRTNSLLPRANKESIYALIKEDLLAAREGLPVAYAAGNKVRPNRYAASALLSRVLLYTGDAAGAELYASEVIGAGSYLLVTNTDNVFVSGSAETIWQLYPVSSSSNTAEGASFIPSSTTVRPVFVLQPGLISAFEAGDKRKVSWVKTNTVSGQPYPYPAKYKVRSSTTKTEFNIVLRLAEQYLIRAEARLQQDRPAEAVADINVIRQRAGLTALPVNLTAAQYLDALRQERRVEFFAEWGHRWFDLKRSGMSGTVLAPLKPAWQATAVLFPLPLAEINRNPFLIQNPGY